MLSLLYHLQNVFLPAGDGVNGTVGLSGYVSDVFGAEARTIVGVDRVTPVTVSVRIPVGGDVAALLSASVGSLVGTPYPCMRATDPIPAVLLCTHVFVFPHCSRGGMM